MKSYTVYMHINKTNNKIYIGKTSKKPEHRWRNGKAYRGAFRADINEFGWDGFEHIILAEGLSEFEARILERAYIRISDATDPEFGYNQTLGGEKANIGWSHSAATKNKMSLNHADFNGSKNPAARPVYCAEIDKEFWGAKQVEEEFKICRVDIMKCCRGKCKSAGKHPITGEKLHWKYADEIKGGYEKEGLVDYV